MKNIFKILVIFTLAAFMSVTAVAHECKFETMRNDAGHWEECLECGEFRNASSHTFEDKHCTVCGIDEPFSIDNHEHLYVYEKSLYGHWMKCRICNQTNNSAEHIFNSEKCIDCGMLVPNNPFKDVTDADWFYTDVLSAYAFGLVNGKNNPDTFCPQDLMTYAEAVKLAACMNELYRTGKVTLTNGTPWYQTYVDYCKASGIITKDYNYNELATRQGYMEIFSKALPDSALEPINDISENFVPDVPSSSEYAEPIYKLYRAGILAGVDSDHNCNPIANIKRCEVATIISRMMDETQRLHFAKFETGEKPSEDMTIDDPANNVEINSGSNISKEYVSDDTNIEVGDNSYTDFVGGDLTVDSMGGILRIERQPIGGESDNYGSKVELYVDVKGGKAPYKYEWFYYGNKNQKYAVENGDYVKDATSQGLILSIEKENTLLGVGIFCKITDSEGSEITSNTVKVYGPFSMTVENYSVVEATKKYTLFGKIADETVKKGDKVSVVRNGKVIAYWHCIRSDNVQQDH